MTVPAPSPALAVRGLRIAFGGDVLALDGVDLTVAEGETLGIVGESGCGKSTLARAVIGLLPGGGRVLDGEVEVAGENLLAMPERLRRRRRGSRVAMVFQEPMTALNPVMTVGAQVVEALRAHSTASRAESRRRAVELLDLVGIPDARRRVGQYPHELSGGMRQRVVIAMAIAGDPALLIADEPTTALDVTVQAQVLALLGDLKARFATAMLLVSHDLGVVAEVADRVAVLYAGRVVEHGPVRDVLRSPAHPYTAGLLASLPPLTGERPHRLPSIPGTAAVRTPDTEGCAFRNRCALATDRCAEEPPEVAVTEVHRAVCWNVGASR